MITPRSTLVGPALVGATVLAAGLALAPLGPAAATTEPPTTGTAATDPPTTDPAGTDPAAAHAGGGNPTACVDPDDIAPGTSLFPDTFEVQYAANLDIAYEDTYKVVTVGATGPDDNPQVYVLVQCGTAAPELSGVLDDAVVVEIPVATIYSESTSHNGFLDVLGVTDRVTGVANGDWVVTESLRQRIDAGDVVSFSPDGLVDVEVVIADDPDVFVSGGFESSEHATLLGAGVPVVNNVEWLEATPQGWAEWVGLFAALTNTEARANELFAGWIAGYDAAAELVVDVDERPTVITGDLFDGTWYASGGGGIVADLIAAAGGDYLYADDDGTGAIALDIEVVLADGVDADVWINPTGFTSRAEAVGIDARYGDFAAWEVGGVWSNTVAPDPAISFAEQGPTMIDAYLLDYIHVFHPELVPDHEPVFLSRLADD